MDLSSRCFLVSWAAHSCPFSQCYKLDAPHSLGPFARTGSSSIRVRKAELAFVERHIDLSCSPDESLSLSFASPNMAGRPSPPSQPFKTRLNFSLEKTRSSLFPVEDIFDTDPKFFLLRSFLFCPSRNPVRESSRRQINLELPIPGHMVRSHFSFVFPTFYLEWLGFFHHPSLSLQPFFFSTLSNTGAALSSPE